jgi:hypothetical protein
LVEQLATIVEQGTSEEALVAVHQLAAMKQPPMGPLIAAALSADTNVASAAKQALRELLDDFGQQVTASRDIAQVADSLHDLVAALSMRQKKFAAADQVWVAETTQTVLRLANELPPHVAPTLAAQCDAILNATDVVALAQASFAPVPLTPSNTESEAREFVPFLRSSNATAQPLPTPTTTQSAASTPDETTKSAASEPLPQTVPLQSATIPEFQNRLRPNVPPDNLAGVQTIPPGPEPLRTASGNGSLTIIPQQPPSAPSSEPPYRRPAAFAIQQLTSLDSRSLLIALQSENGANALAIEDELARRGFGTVTKALVDQFLSTDVAARMRVIDVVLNNPSLGARPWLLLFAEDEHADVRLLAITILATSRDTTLIEKAWQLAIRDRDPRIAALAPRLRERHISSIR